MTTLREAAEMALKALIEYEEHEEQEYGFHRKMAEIDALGGTPPAIVALRAALAEPVQERKPLTEEELSKIIDTQIGFNSCVGWEEDFARAIERAHGIGGAPEERNFCPRCGKRTNDIHTCTPP